KLRPGIRPVPVGRHHLERAAVIMNGQTQLLDVVGALRTCRRLTHLLHGGHQKADQDGDNGDDHQQLDQGEGTSLRKTVRRHGTTSKRRQRIPHFSVNSRSYAPGFGFATTSMDSGLFAASRYLGWKGGGFPLLCLASKAT